MIYYGKGIKIPFDTQVFDSKDEITIYQQHCGGENLLVYSGLHDEGGYCQIFFYLRYFDFNFFFAEIQRNSAGILRGTENIRSVVLFI